MAKTINLDSLIEIHLIEESYVSDIKYNKDFIKSICIEAITEALELASENASTKTVWFSTGDYGGWDKEVVDKQSITNTINQIV